MGAQAIGAAPRARLGAIAPHRRLRARILDVAVNGLRRRAPHRSASRRLTPDQAVAMCAGGAYGLGWLAAAPGPALSALAVLASIGFVSLIAFRAWAALTVRAPAPARLAGDDEAPVYSVLAPVFREAGVVAGLLAALERLNYPQDRLDVILVVEEDDAATLAAARAAAGPHIRILPVPPGGPRTKPKALTYALTFARGDLLTIYDAEDRPHPDQLRAAAAAFADGGESLVCLQAPLAYYNAADNWLTRCFQLEYAIHFRVILPALIRMGAPIPLGGTSNHFRTARLRAAGGWDPFNVTEDADLGLRILADGARAAMIAPPTMEEATCTLKAWVRQRSRWLKGYAQTVLVHTRRDGARFRPLKAAALWLTLGGALAAAAAHAPALAWLAAALALGAPGAGAALAILAAGYLSTIAAACAAARLTGDRALLIGLVFTPAYWPLQTVAAAMAMVQLVSAPFRWEKTEHGVSPAGRPEGRGEDAAARIAAE